MQRIKPIFFAVLLICISLLSVPVLATQLDIPPGSHRFEIQLEGEQAYKYVQLNADVYTRAAPDLSNLRIVDGGGAAVPWFSWDASLEYTARNASFHGSYVSRFEKDGTDYFDFEIATDPSSDAYGNSLVLDIPNDAFAKQVTLEGSHDGVAWASLLQGLVYRVNSTEETELQLAGVEKYTWYRVGVPNNAEAIDIRSVELRYSAETEQRSQFVETLLPDWTVEEGERETCIRIPGEQVRGLRLVALYLDSGSMFSRRVSTPMGQGELYNLSFQSHTLSGTRLHLSGGRYSGTEDFVITIRNEDDAPIQVDDIRLAYTCDRIAFRTEPGQTYYLVLLAGDHQKPSYDISSYADHVLGAGVDACSYTLLAQTPEDSIQEEAGGIPDAWILNGALACASLVLIVLIVRAAVKKKG